MDRTLLQSLQCLLRQLPVHPRVWRLLAASCRELHDTVVTERQMLRSQIRSKQQDEISWCDQWAAALLLELAEDGETAEAIRVIVAGASDGWRYSLDYWLDDGDDTVLIGAAKRGHTEIAVALIDAAAHVDSQSPSGNTPLLLACRLGHLEIAEALIGAGAQLDLQNNGGRTPLALASARGHKKIAEALISAGA